MTGCATTVQQMLPSDSYLATPPLIAPRTQSQDILKSLPEPADRITVSVYEFMDQTGQNKPGDTPEYSRAVTQGGLAILKKALLDAGDKKWFRVLERGGLNDLLQERKIVRSTRDEYLGPDGKPLPDLGPLLYSGVLLEGGIIAYESNIMTGGAGARYLGIGATSEYRRDIVTVALRAVSVVNGEVLLAVTTSKTIYSTSIQGDFFKFVSFDKLLEAEGGVTFNEPPQFAVRQAIEMAVYSLIMEGYQDGLWQFEDPAAGKKAYADYVSRREGSSKPTKVIATKTSSQAPAATTPAAPSAKTSNKAVETASVRVPRGWYTQVAALPHGSSNANDIIAQLQKNGFPVIIESTTIESIPYRRVLVGPFADASAAASAKDQVIKRWNGDLSPFVKRYE